MAAAAATSKPALSFSFSKKAEPKRKVEALAVEKKQDERIAISGVEEGKVTVDGPIEEAKKLTIPCKNVLQQAPAKKTPADPDAMAKAAAAKKALLEKSLEDHPGGLVQNNIGRLSDADAEAARELIKEASLDPEGTGGGPLIAAQPILMREGSKRAREGDAPDASKEMFDRVPVESFGEALLRGMGYDPEKQKTKPVYYDKPRDNLLGLGAKALLPHEKLAAAKRKAAAKASGSGTAAKDSDSTPAPDAPTPLEKGTDAIGEKGNANVKKQRVEPWPSRGLVVRVIGKEGQLREFFGAEVVVLEVNEGTGSCRVKGRPIGDANGKSRVLQDVSIVDLETRVSRDCQSVRIVRGTQRGVVAKLLKRDVKRGKALLDVEGKEFEMELDDVCQFMG